MLVPGNTIAKRDVLLSRFTKDDFLNQAIFSVKSVCEFLLRCHTLPENIYIEIVVKEGITSRLENEDLE